MTRKILFFGAAAAVLLTTSALVSVPALADSHDVNAAGAATTTDTATTTGAASTGMMADKTIVETAVDTPDLSQLVSAVKAADLVETLSGAGPFTVFAPTNEAFGKLPSETASSLMEPANKEQLKDLLTYHVIPEEVTSDQLVKAIEANNGEYELTTVEGAKLTAMMDGSDVVISDASGGKAKVTGSEMKQSNGVVHVIDSVLMPKM